MRKHYIALIHKDDAGFGVSFPDFPGAVTTAHNLEEAVERAGKALALLVEGMAEDGEPIPPPSGFAEVIKDNPDAMPMLVPLPLARTAR
jgi:predicted RNase H-like HicB family nuclease